MYFYIVVFIQHLAILKHYFHYFPTVPENIFLRTLFKILSPSEETQ